MFLNVLGFDRNPVHNLYPKFKLPDDFGGLCCFVSLPPAEVGVVKAFLNSVDVSRMFEKKARVKR